MQRGGVHAERAGQRGDFQPAFFFHAHFAKIERKGHGASVEADGVQPDAHVAQGDVVHVQSFCRFFVGQVVAHGVGLQAESLGGIDRSPQVDKPMAQCGFRDAGFHAHAVARHAQAEPCAGEVHFGQDDFPVYCGRSRVRGFGMPQGDIHICIRERGRAYGDCFLRELDAVGVHVEMADVPAYGHTLDKRLGIDRCLGEFNAFHVYFTVEDGREAQVHGQLFHVEQNVFWVGYLHVLQGYVEQECEPQLSDMHVHPGSFRGVCRGFAHSEVLNGWNVKQCGQYKE